MVRAIEVAVGPFVMFAVVEVEEVEDEDKVVERAACNCTFTISNGCPANTRHIPIGRRSKIDKVGKRGLDIIE